MSPKRLTDSSEPRVKRARKGTKRSRAGCLTCKFRKVKCDEIKPECTRCKSFGIKCDGYEQPKPKAALPNHRVRLPASASRLLPAPSSTMKFESEMEQRHFQFFQTDLVAELAGAFDNRFWHRLIMQGCHDEPFIMKTVTALSALSTAKKLTQIVSHGPTICSAMAASHLEFAFVEYDKALHLMTVTLEDQPSPRKALMMCLLICCFEGMAGNTLAAIDHAKSGQKLLDQWMAGHPYSGSAGEGIKSPASHIVEDEVIQAAAFFELQIVGFFDTREKEEHSIRKLEGTESGDAPDLGVEYFSCGDCPNFGPTIAEDAMEFREEQSQYCHEIVAWRSSFREIYRRTRLSQDRRAIAAAQTLLVQARSYSILLAAMTDTDNMSFDNHLSQFKDILSLCREVIQTKKDLSTGQFCFEMGIIPALHTTAKWCRDRKVRREAISLMQWYDSREGYWDCATMAKLNTILMELEEQGIEGDFVPEHARIRMVGFKANHPDSLVNIHYVLGSLRTGQKRCELEYAWKLPGPWPSSSLTVSNSFALMKWSSDSEDSQ
ncbi:hypothetical protein DL98DRAFT_463570 [Cadophora sp. DSE1049]|nr:hypothetical protein DL98DRAFT_463570 [Cadophora sp. DSE1049]